MSLVQQVARNNPTRRRAKTGVKGNVGSDQTTLAYRASGNYFTTNAGGEIIGSRLYIPGHLGSAILANAGVGVCSYYSGGKFLPGTHSKWTPGVGFTATGRVFVAFTTSPEVYISWATLATNAAKIDAIRGFGNCVSFPSYQETTVQVPTTLRRRLFDVNINPLPDADEYDRSCQIFMMWGAWGAPATTNLGNFEYHDRVYMEGLSMVPT